MLTEQHPAQPRSRTDRGKRAGEVHDEQQHGGHDRAQQDQQHQEADQQHERRDEQQILLVAGAGVDVRRDRPTDERVRIRHGVHRVAQLGDLVQALLGARGVVTGHHDLREGAVLGRADRLHAHDAFDVLRRRDDVPCLRRIGDHEDRLRLARREVRREHFEPRRRLRGHPELLHLVEPDQGAEQARGHHRQQRATREQGHERTLHDTAGDPAPHPSLPALLTGTRQERPEHLRPAHREQRRQQEQDGGECDQQADRRGDPEPVRPGNHGQHEREEREHHGDVRGDDRGRRLAPGGAERATVIGLLLQLFAVARDQQQGVVRAGAEHQHADDARVELQAPRGSGRRGHPARESVRERDDHERDQPQDRRAIGQDEQDRDDEDRDDQQREVGALER